MKSNSSVYAMLGKALTNENILILLRLKVDDYNEINNLISNINLLVNICNEYISFCNKYFIFSANNYHEIAHCFLLILV